jgi:hypothetical protein
MGRAREVPWRVCATALVFCAVLSISCISSRHQAFRVIPHTPSYLLRSPDSRETPLSEVLHAYNGFERAQSWMDLRSEMVLRVENAYYEPGASRHGLEGFLGTEVALYEVTARGLRLLSVEPLKDPPEGEPAVQDLIRSAQMSLRYFRLYFEIVFAQNNDAHGSVLLAANSTDELDGLSARLNRPETVCNDAAPHCTVFPEACTVSVQIHIVVNGKARNVDWGGALMEIVTDHPQHLELRRLYAGQLIPVQIDPRDRNALQLPLLPGDEVNWK